MGLTTQAVFEIIIDRLVDKSPFALTRCGDGDAKILEGNIEKIRLLLEKYLWHKYDDMEIQNFRQTLIEAYMSSDIIGIQPSRYGGKLPYFYWDCALDILQSVCCISTQQICSTNIHYDLLQKKYYEKLLQNRDVLFYISCRNVDCEIKKRYNIKNVFSFIVAPERVFEPNYLGLRHYPDQFEQVVKWIKCCNCSGEMCLVGAGPLGKKYVTLFKERGGIALDIGSVFDLWAGKVTRGPGAGPGKISDTHKL